MNYSETRLASTSCSSFTITGDELEALKRALLALRDAVKPIAKSKPVRQAWNAAVQTVDAILRNVESTESTGGQRSERAA
jgi:hemoglobin-like flavoprotein